jgi:nucleotide-binding universal stress UspA family protein
MMIDRILVPLDGSKLAEKALPYAGNLAEKFEAEIVLVRVIQPTPIKSFYDDTMFNGAGYGSMPSYGSSTYGQTDVNLSNFYLTSAQTKLRRRNLAVRTIIAEGYPESDTIVDLARREMIKLVVMRTHGRSGASRWEHGSVADGILHCAPCPIFLVRAAGPAC